MSPLWDSVHLIDRVLLLETADPLITEDGDFLLIQANSHALRDLWSLLCSSVRTDFDTGIDFAVTCVRDAGNFPDFVSVTTELQHVVRPLVRDP